MNKAEFITFISEQSGKSKVEAEGSLNLIVDSVLKATALGQNISLVGFGAWSVVRRNGREGHNPKTGAKMKIEAYNQPVFKAGQKLKDACNQK